MATITYEIGQIPHVDQIIDVFEKSNINRPTDNKERIEQMFVNADLLVTAWHEEELIGLARALTDFCYACYLSDLAVKKKYQNQGIGRELIRQIQKQIGEQTALILISAPNATNYYPKVGFRPIDNGYIINRVQ